MVIRINVSKWTLKLKYHNKIMFVITCGTSNYGVPIFHFKPEQGQIKPIFTSPSKGQEKKNILKKILRRQANPK